jgi:hypothetical protein
VKALACRHLHPVDMIEIQILLCVYQQYRVSPEVVLQSSDFEFPGKKKEKKIISTSDPAI